MAVTAAITHLLQKAEKSQINQDSWQEIGSSYNGIVLQNKVLIRSIFKVHFCTSGKSLDARKNIIIRIIFHPFMTVPCIRSTTTEYCYREKSLQRQELPF